MQSYVSALLALFTVDLVAAMLPGPNFLLVSQLGLSSGRRTAAASVVGILTGNIMWATAVALGLGAVFSVVPLLYHTLKIAGGIYLIYLAVMLWKEHRDDSVLTWRTTAWSAYVRGFLTTIANPKCLLYFGSVFTLLLRPTTPPSVWLIGISIVAFNTVLWYGTVAMLFSHEAAKRIYQSAYRRINAVAGVIIAGFGLKLVIDSD